MRTYLIISLVVFLNMACLTVDPPRPSVLGAPVNLTAVITEFDSTFSIPGEYIRIGWNKNNSDTISSASYTILSFADSTGISGKVTNIPANINSYFVPVSEIYIQEFRDQERFIAYSIFGIDTLGRPGDTSAQCTITIAPSVLLSTPGATIIDTTSNIKFKWFVRKIQDQTISLISLWKENSKIWISEPESLYTGGEDITAVTRTLPDSLTPLSEGQYEWSVSLRIIKGNDEPKSFTIKELNVLKQ